MHHSLWRPYSRAVWSKEICMVYSFTKLTYFCFLECQWCLRTKRDDTVVAMTAVTTRTQREAVRRNRVGRVLVSLVQNGISRFEKGNGERTDGELYCSSKQILKCSTIMWWATPSPHTHTYIWTHIPNHHIYLNTMKSSTAHTSMIDFAESANIFYYLSLIFYVWLPHNIIMDTWLYVAGGIEVRRR